MPCINAPRACAVYHLESVPEKRKTHTAAPLLAYAPNRIPSRLNQFGGSTGRHDQPLRWVAPPPSRCRRRCRRADKHSQIRPPCSHVVVSYRIARAQFQ